jgi:hypothetical protein
MGDGVKLATAIAVMWLALVFFFFAFHPGGVEGVSNPVQMLQWLMNEFQNLTGGNQSSASTNTAGGIGAGLSNYPGYTETDAIGNATPADVQLA